MDHDEKNESIGREKVVFRFERDQQGYPPCDWESVWAYPTHSGHFQLDNIPFFVRGVSLGDIVATSKIDGENRFVNVIEPSGHSTIRVMLYQMEQCDSVRLKMLEMGATWEESHIPGLTAFDIPPHVGLNPIVQFLKQGHEQGLWDYEEACLAHSIQN